jgi:hypothetical protein
MQKSFLVIEVLAWNVSFAIFKIQGGCAYPFGEILEMGTVYLNPSNDRSTPREIREAICLVTSYILYR